MKVLFISDNSLTHSILQSQGIPQIINNSQKGIESGILTFEPHNVNRKLLFEIRETLLKDSVKIVNVQLPKNTFPSGRLWVWMLGLISVLKYCYKYSPDILHVRSYPPMLIALAAKKMFSKKILFDMRGIYVEENIENGVIRRDSIVHRLEKKLEKIYVKYSDAIVSVSQNQKKYIEKITGTKKNASYVVTNKTIISNYTSVNDNISNENIRFIFSGVFAGRYDIRKIIEFFKVSYEVFKYPKLDLLIYVNTDKVEELLKEYPDFIRKNIGLYKCLQKEIPFYLSKADVGLLFLKPLISSFVSSPIKIPEYLASGLPVVMSNGIGDVSEIISERNVGIILNDDNYLDSLQKLKELLKDENIKIRARNVAEQEFNLNNSFEQYLNIYKNLLK